MNIIECDVLIVGGGLAAASAVKRASEMDVKICQVVKGTYGMVGQRGSGASACGASEEGGPRLATMPDSPDALRTLYDMIIQAGLGVVDRNLAKVMVEDFPKLQALLRKWNIAFDGKGPYHLGYPFIHAIEPDVRSSAIQLFEHTMITDLLIHARSTTFNGGPKTWVDFPRLFTNGTTSYTHIQRKTFSPSWKALLKKRPVYGHPVHLLAY